MQINQIIKNPVESTMHNSHPCHLDYLYTHAAVRILDVKAHQIGRMGEGARRPDVIVAIWIIYISGRGRAIVRKCGHKFDDTEIVACRSIIIQILYMKIIV
jgi:hypothetical protein